MKTIRVSGLFAAVALLAIAGNALAAAPFTKIRVKLSGNEEVPPVATLAEGTGAFILRPDGSFSGTVMTEHMEGTAAHIHQGKAGSNGPVVIPLTKTEDHHWRAPRGTKLTREQIQALNKGELYVNVHSKAHPGGEIRGQLGRSRR